MSNWFAGIGQAASGLNAARYGLSVVGQNMSNADTVGYTRQTSQQASVDMGTVPGLYAGHGALGGVTVTGTSRSTDPVLDARLRTEHARGALADTASTQLTNVEAVFPEPDDNGLAAQLNDFWGAWATVANNPGPASNAGASAARTVLLNDASTVAATLNGKAQSLSDLATDTQRRLGSDVDAVNDAANRLATLNGSIAVASATGANVNSLLDQRDQILDSLSTLSGASVTLEANGAATVTLGGQSLVSGSTAATVSLTGTAVSVGGTAVSVGGGSIAAEQTALTTTIPGFRAGLDAVADALTSTVNSVQTGGFDLSGAAGSAMFAGSGAAGIHVVLTDPNGIAASSSPGGNLDGSNALAASRSATNAGSPDARYTTLVGDVASASASARQYAATQDAVVSNVDALKASVSGVSLDEEASTMLTYQQAFNASSRVLTALDSMLDTLINHTGVVGLS